MVTLNISDLGALIRHASHSCSASLIFKLYIGLFVIFINTHIAMLCAQAKASGEKPGRRVLRSSRRISVTALWSTVQLEFFALTCINYVGL